MTLDSLIAKFRHNMHIFTFAATFCKCGFGLFFATMFKGWSCWTGSSIHPAWLLVNKIQSLSNRRRPTMWSRVVSDSMILFIFYIWYTYTLFICILHILSDWCRTIWFCCFLVVSYFYFKLKYVLLVTCTWRQYYNFKSFK